MRVVLSAALLLALSGPAAALELAERLPGTDLALPLLDGSDVKLADVRGERGTLVLFICVHCPWVRAWGSRIAAVGAAAQQAGIGVLAVNSNDPRRMRQDGVGGMRKQAAELGFSFGYAVDAGSRLARVFAAKRTPEAFLFDAGDRLVYRGTIDDNAHDAGDVEQHFLRDAVRAVAAGRPPMPSETKALGCTLKLYE